MRYMVICAYSAGGSMPTYSLVAFNSDEMPDSKALHYFLCEFSAEEYSVSFCNIPPTEWEHHMFSITKEGAVITDYIFL